MVTVAGIGQLAWSSVVISDRPAGKSKTRVRSYTGGWFECVRKIMKERKINKRPEFILICGVNELGA